MEWAFTAQQVTYVELREDLEHSPLWRPWVLCFQRTEELRGTVVYPPTEHRDDSFDDRCCVPGPPLGLCMTFSPKSPLHPVEQVMSPSPL